MAVTNRDRVGKGLDLLAAGLRPFVERELTSVLGENWQFLLPTPPTVSGCSPCHGPPQPTSAWTPSHHQQRSTCIRRTLTQSLLCSGRPVWPRGGRR